MTDFQDSEIKRQLAEIEKEIAYLSLLHDNVISGCSIEIRKEAEINVENQSSHLNRLFRRFYSAYMLAYKNSNRQFDFEKIILNEQQRLSGKYKAAQEKYLEKLGAFSLGI